MKKRALILALAGIMAASLTGCGSLKDDAVVVKAGDEEITAGVANFYARYTPVSYTHLDVYKRQDQCTFTD